MKLSAQAYHALRAFSQHIGILPKKTHSYFIAAQKGGITAELKMLAKAQVLYNP
jgi:hypothetical protein